MNLLILICAVLLNILLGLTVLIRNRKSATNILFFLLNIDIALWSVTNYFSLNPIMGVPVIIWMRLVMFLAIPQAVLFFLLIDTFPKTKICLSKPAFIGVIIASILAMGVAISPFLFTEIGIKNGISSPNPGPGMLLFVPVAIGSLIAGIVTLIKKYVKSSGIEKTQLRFILGGVLTMFLLIITFNFVLVVFFKNLNFISLSPLYTLPFVAMVTYSVIKHRFLDIGLIVARSVTFAIIVIFIAAFYAFTFLLFGRQFLHLDLNVTQQSVLIILTITLVISFQVIQRFIERITSKVLFRGRYNVDEVLSELGRMMASTLHLEEVTHKILRKLTDDVQISRAAFILINVGMVSDVRSEGYTTAPTLDEEEVKVINQADKILVFDELNEGEEKSVMRKMEISVVVPLKAEGDPVGLLILGPKKSGDIYSEEDLNLLEILAPEVAVAIQNAKAYEEIRRFNVTLQEEINKATNDLKKANVQLQELDKLKDEFVSLASHELRTPMTAIRGSLATILEGYAGELSSEAKEFLTAAYNENDRLIRLVNNLLNISRIEAGRFTFNIAKINLEDVIMEVVNNLNSAAKEKNLILEYKKDGPLPLTIADPDKIREVLINLIGNAVKFTHVGGVTVTTKINGSDIVTSVSDTGSGIAKEDTDLLFKKFSQIQGDYAKQSGGTGLGLYICKQIIEGLGGKIWLESIMGRGSSFFFSLPISKE
jgi:signal transduction histidine kinase